MKLQKVSKERKQEFQNSLSGTTQVPATQGASGKLRESCEIGDHHFLASSSYATRLNSDDKSLHL